MKKHFLLFTVILCCFLGGCGNSNQATVDVLETCKVINSTITETSISEDKEYFTITFENGLFYCEDKTGSYTVYTIKIPADKEFDMFAILTSIAPTLTEENFNKLEENNEVSFLKEYRNNWHCYKSIEGDTIKYVLK